jgi:hypothetical protein
MKQAFVIATALVMMASAGLAQNGSLALYADPGFLDCSFLDTSVGPVVVYVVHRAPAGASGVHFRLAPSPGFTCAYQSVDFGSGFGIGSPTSGAGVSYGLCATTDILVATVTYSCLGTSATCAYLSAEADPNYPSGQLVATDCEVLPGSSSIPGSKLYANPNNTCGCSVGVEPSTWGEIKALYGNE